MILLVGSRGQLGWELLHAAQECGLDCEGLDTPQFDLIDKEAAERAFGGREFSLVINAAAYTAVDKAESEREQAFAVNAEGPRYLAIACAKNNIPLIHISTDYVFDGTRKTPYTEGDLISPMGVYGESKAAGEASVRDNLNKHIILRTSWLYSSHGNNFVKTILHLAGEREELRVVADQYGCPTYAADLAEAILHIAEQIRSGRSIPWGTYHYCGKGVTTWHGFAEKICELTRKYRPLRVKRIKAISTEEYPTTAKRPPYSALDCSKIERLLGIRRRPWQESLAEMITKAFRTLGRSENSSDLTPSTTSKP
jgi:dTDP-4-dehydrorhamnose reductase